MHSIKPLRRQRCRTDRYFIAASSALLLCLSQLGQEAKADVFDVSAMTTEMPPPPGLMSLSVTENKSDLPSLLRDVAGTKKGTTFAKFSDRQFSGSVNYGGVSNAVSFFFDLTGTKPVQGFENLSPGIKTARFVFKNGSVQLFQDPDSGELKNKIVKYFERNGSTQLANVSSPVAVGDGNPNAATAVAANGAFGAFGQNRGETGLQSFDALSPFDVEISSFTAGGFDGFRLTVPVSVNFRIPQILDNRVSISLAGFFTYIDVEDAKVYQGGGFVGLPVQIIRRQKIETPARGLSKDGKDSKQSATIAYTPWSWTVTPSFGAAVSGSSEFIQGNLFYIPGLTSALTYNFDQQFSVTTANAFYYMIGGGFSIGDYEFGAGEDQVIFKNGLVARYKINERLALTSDATATNFYHRAAVQAYATLGAGVSYSQPLTSRGLDGLVALTQVGFVTDQGQDFHSYGGRISFSLRF